MAADFTVIVFTPEEPVSNEARRIAQLLESGAADRVHLRHPALSETAIRAILESLPADLLPRITLHSHFELTDRFPVGIHLNSRNPYPPEDFAGTLSRSCHSLSELATKADKFDYSTLSPIFNSISKSGYNAAFKLTDASLIQALKDSNVVALGGVTPDRFHELHRAGFAGAAMLGYCWPDDPTLFANRINETLKARNSLCSNS